MLRVYTDVLFAEDRGLSHLVGTGLSASSQQLTRWQKKITTNKPLVNPYYS